MINQDFQAFQTIETNQRAGFRVLSIGGVPFVQPFPGVLNPDQVAALQNAARISELGRRRVAEAIVGHVQRELGVSPDLHALGISIAAERVAREKRDQRARRVGQVRRAAIAANRTVAEPEPTSAIREALREGTAALAQLRAARAEAKAAREALAEIRKAGQVPSLEQVERANRARTASWSALALMRERSLTADQLRREQLDAFWAQQSAAETAELASARGEEIGKAGGPDAPKALRISSRDGLATLFEAGVISAHQYGAGRAYRVAYETAAKVRIASLNPSGVSAGKSPAGLQARSAHELQRAYVLARLRQIELAVAGLGERELTVLRKVAGEGMTIHQIGGGGKPREKNKAALRRALDVAVSVLAGPIHVGLKRSPNP
ncbi:hypothetical protein [Phenylobacterium sp.]|uniref:hypothetical protein n=1 Tax=Phenylobacterium sp. TaxID=1871053 RepID=UPI0019AB80A5|nr:hypothetical protein [Phenylobacterium sp.]MBC7168984.1 hypothetical protein [Phenylobacterium sp.]